MANEPPKADNDEPPTLESILGGPQGVEIFSLMCANSALWGLLVMKTTRTEEGYHHRLYVRMYGVNIYLCSVDSFDNPSHDGPGF